MAENDERAVGVPLFRVTLLGPHFAGKTWLANAILNNVAPNTTRSTTLPELYYHVVRLSYDEPLVNEGYDDINAFCLEIEDTCVEDDLHATLDMSKEPWPFNQDMLDYTPFGIFQAPRVPFKRGDPLKAISQGRMSFLVVFDVTCEESFKSATALIEYILSRSNKVGATVPVVGLVANKIDLVRSSHPVFAQAETFAQLKTIPFYRVSSLTRKNVDEMIKEVAFLIYGNVNLWEIVVQG